MTTADELRAASNYGSFKHSKLLTDAALELDQRDDTIAQLRAERDHWHTVAKCLQTTIDDLKATPEPQEPPSGPSVDIT